MTRNDQTATGTKDSQRQNTSGEFELGLTLVEDRASPMERTWRVTRIEEERIVLDLIDSVTYHEGIERWPIERDELRRAIELGTVEVAEEGQQ